jgi:hypothetical protein
MKDTERRLDDSTARGYGAPARSRAASARPLRRTPSPHWPRPLLALLALQALLASNLSNSELPKQ